MNQNVRTTDNPTFNRVYLSDYGYALGGFHVGGSSDPGTDNLLVDGGLTVGGDVRFTKLVCDKNIGAIGAGASADFYIESYGMNEGRTYIPMLTRIINQGSSLKCEVYYRGQLAPNYNIDVYVRVTNSGTSGTSNYTTLKVIRLS